MGTNNRGWAIAPLLLGGLVALLLAVVGSGLPHGSAADAWRSATRGYDIDLDEWLGTDGERLSPSTLLPQAHRLAPEVLAFLNASCDALPTLQGDVSREKLVAFRRFECGHQPLPDGFFAAAPYMHPLGRSYAARANRPHPRHIEETPGAPLARLSGRAREQLVAGATTVVDHHVILERRGESWVQIPRRSFERSLGWSGFSRPENCATAACLEPATRDAVRWSAWLTLMCLGTASIAFGWSAMADRRRHREEQRFLIRALTHELRTPATAVGLSLDQIRPHFEELPPPVQDAFLGLTAANQRLRNTLAATGSMLTLLESGRPLELQTCDVAEVLEAVGETGPRGIQVRTDRALLQLVLGNLVANAHHHGQPPVTITATREAGGITLVVQDAGTFDGDLEQLARPFARGDESDGLGLGLTLVHEALTALGGRWSVSADPTRFSLHIPDR